MTTPSKRSKKSARPAGASGSVESALPPKAEVVEAEETHSEEPRIEGQEVAPPESTELAESAEEASAEEAEESEPTVLMGGSAEPEQIEDKEDEPEKPVSARAAPKTRPLPAVSPDLVSEPETGEAEGDVTMIARTPSRPRKTTLAMAITPRPMPVVSDSQEPRDSAYPAAAADAAGDGEVGARRGGETSGMVAD